MTRQRHPILMLGAVLTALVVCLGALSMDASARGKRSHHHELTKHQKAAVRRRLQRQVRTNPQAILKRGFLQKAQTVGLSLPLTLRLRRSGRGPIDDALAVAWDSSTWAWPTGFTQLRATSDMDPPPGGVVPLDGDSSVIADFGTDVVGYGEPGVVGTTNGTKLMFASDIEAAPIAVTSLPACQTAGVGDPTVSAVRLTRMNLETGEGTSGLLSLFGGTARVSLHVRLSTTTQSLDTNCDGVFGDIPAGLYDQHPSRPAGDPVVPISLDAQFRVSPAIDADGKLRFGVLTLPSGVVQPTTFALISTRVLQIAADSCQVTRFPARLSISQLNAEILLGDQIS